MACSSIIFFFISFANTPHELTVHPICQPLKLLSSHVTLIIRQKVAQATCRHQQFRFIFLLFASEILKQLQGFGVWQFICHQSQSGGRL
jgi:hypothetical protein